MIPPPIPAPAPAANEVAPTGDEAGDLPLDPVSNRLEVERGMEREDITG